VLNDTRLINILNGIMVILAILGGIYIPEKRPIFGAVGTIGFLSSLWLYLTDRKIRRILKKAREENEILEVQASEIQDKEKT